MLVPYQCAGLPPGPWLIFAPHADDETFGMGGALRLAADQGIATHVIVITDGALGGESVDAAQAAALVQTRQQELNAACALLGVSDIDTWDQPDRGLVLAPALIERIASQIADVRAGTVFFPGPLELHPDHRMTALLVWQAAQVLRRRAWRGALPQLWSYEISVQSPVNRLLDITSVTAIKQQAMAVYASQNSQNNYPELIMALNKARTFSLPAAVSHAEAFYQFSDDEAAGSLRAAAEAALARYFAVQET
ncbi:MAG: PIG-L family deacetylase [Pseudohongiella sp.]|uniref:PIG-L deacetylase family protein n=1 Tax=Pseudohongiella sp. TaxID=1979412 RepID=UPI0034A03256